MFIFNSKTILEYARKHIIHREYLLLFMGIALWIPGSRNGYFLSDDFVHLVDWGQPPLWNILTWTYSEYAGFYRPLTALWWKGQYELWGQNPTGYQLTNLALHATCVFLVRDMARQLFPSRPRIGLWSGLIFLFLPGHIFGVLMISALTGLLCTTFYLIAVCLYLRGRIAFSTIAFLLAILTKELALSLSLLIAVWEYLRQRKNENINWNMLLRTIAPYFLLTLAYILGRYIIFGHLPHSPMHDNSSLARILINSAVYTAQMSIPWGLHGFKPFFRSHPNALLAGAIISFALFSVAIWHSRRRLSIEHILALLWIAITLGPVLRLYSPWNTYLPAAGVAILLASITDTFPKRMQNYILTLFLCISVTYSLFHQHHWQQARTLSRQVVSSALEQVSQSSATLYVANLPAEWNGAPILVGDWALSKALKLQGIPMSRIEVLTNVIHFQRYESVDILRPEENGFEIKLHSPLSFFRMETMEILSGSIKPEQGYELNNGDVNIRVIGLNEQGKPNHLRFDMIEEKRLQQTLFWDGSQLIPIAP